MRRAPCVFRTHHLAAVPTPFVGRSNSGTACALRLRDTVADLSCSYSRFKRRVLRPSVDLASMGVRYPRPCAAAISYHKLLCKETFVLSCSWWVPLYPQVIPFSYEFAPIFQI